jgi:hypothetical protein
MQMLPRVSSSAAVMNGSAQMHEEHANILSVSSPVVLVIPEERQTLVSFDFSVLPSGVKFLFWIS